MVLVAASSACRHLSPEARPAPGWEVLARPAGSFTALYRISCCGHRDLLATVRAGEAALALAVVSPPGATVAECWIDDNGGWVAEDRGRCRRPIGVGTLPFPGGAALPLDYRAAALLLSGRLPAAGKPSGDGGLIVGHGDGFEWQAEVAGTPPRCVRFRISGSGGVELEAELGGHRGSLPGTLRITAGGERVEMVLQEWRGTPGPEAPRWMAAPRCGGES